MGKNPICIVCQKDIPIVAEQIYDEEGKLVMELYRYVPHWVLLDKQRMASSVHTKCLKEKFDDINPHLLHPFKVPPK